MDSSMYDSIIIGAGPAGSTAGLYAARASLNVLVVERGMPGGQIATSHLVDNYPGLPDIGGVELGERMRAHAEAAGASFEYGAIEQIRRGEPGFEVDVDGKTLMARTVIVASGAVPRPAGVKGEDFFRGRGISYCATCDGMFYRNKTVYVVGGGNSACEEGLFLSNIAKHVVMLVRRDEFRASRGRVDLLLAQDNVEVRYLTSIVEVTGERFIGSITFEHNDTKERYVETFDEGSAGVFVFTGNDPVVELVRPYVTFGPDGGVITDDSMSTDTPGLFCAGDMRSKRLRQVITAASDGAIAATAAYEYIQSLASNS